MTDTTPTYVSTALAADLTGLSRRTVRRVIVAGKLPAVLVGGGWVISRAELGRWLQCQLVQSRPRRREERA